ncbi:Mov34/MPN/PAD-1 family protein [Neptuniibacter sp. QD37_11]|uniref:Mov34/MPN/PAD-1 family protein n=1 Tax=Neptuniibacter sp. QD37_11 TaxID=3398209 RepID=UPI0039F4604A
MRIKQKVLDIWDEHKQKKLTDNEQFGVLIGSFSEPNDYLINEVTVPIGLDRSTRTRFSLVDPYHQEKVNQHFKQSQGQLAYIGTWHTHPEPHPKPSKLDIKDWEACCKRNPDRSLIFVIVGTDSITIYTSANGSLREMKAEYLINEYD